MSAEIPDFPPPEDIRLSERVVAGAAMMSRGAAEALAEIVQPECFRENKPRLVYEAALALAVRGDPVDPVAVLGELRRTGSLRDGLAGPYVHDCMAAGAVPSPAWHAERVAADWRRRSVGYALVSASSLISHPGFDPATGFDQVRAIVDGALATASASHARTISEIVTATVQRIEDGAERGLPTPWADLNDAITGFAPGEMIIVAARPSTGKSVVGAQVAAYAALTLGVPSLLMSMEMSAEELTMRLIAAQARVPLTTLLRSEVKSDADWEKIARAARLIADSPLEIDDSADCTLAHVRARLGGMQRGAGCGLVVIDYLGLMTPPKAENRQNQVALLSRELKKIAREFSVPVVVLAQLNRAPEQRHDKRPTSSDLRDSGSQEQDADVILLLHQPEEHPGTLEVIVDKQRQGPRHVTVSLTFQGAYARCADLSLKEYPR